MPAPLCLLQITDPHLFAHDGGEIEGVNTQTSLSAVLAGAQARADWPPQAVLATGDLVHDHTRAGYERFRTNLAGFGLPVYCIPGNHDEPGLMREMLDTAPFQFCGAAEYGPWAIAMLDTHLPGSNGGRLGDSELARLDALLAGWPDRHVLVCLHHQPVPMGSPWIDSLGIEDVDELLAIVARHGNVRALLWGHVHQESDRMRDGLRLMSTPSTCAQFAPFTEVFTVDDAAPGYRWLELAADGGIVSEVIRVPFHAR
ncbi:MAG TPA: 3',5'-cyclic-AMP phosphodiesterase [Gammaproteobacteria bacterium]|nr:3',5'-cyclic-AMP phosphodiesterase [Gammaproteobacteria bacterium]